MNFRNIVIMMSKFGSKSGDFVQRAKNKLILFLFLINFSFVLSQKQNIIEHLICDIITENQEYLNLELNPQSFIPELNNELKLDENYKYTMNEVKDKNFIQYFQKVKNVKRINWKNYKLPKFKYDAKKYGIEFSTPIFINGNKEVLIQIKTNYVNWFNVYKLNKNNKWELSYGFGNKKLPKT